MIDIDRLTTVDVCLYCFFLGSCGYLSLLTSSYDSWGRLGGTNVTKKGGEEEKGAGAGRNNRRTAGTRARG